jgi:hypothetical protein
MAGKRLRVVQHWEHRDGFQATLCARTGRLPFPRSPINEAIFDTVEQAEEWCVAMIEENADRLGPFVNALIERYSGPVSVVELAANPLRRILPNSGGSVPSGSPSPPSPH